ncbi:MAG: O-antigen ligase family protein [Lentisphaerae bacterium]|nr:O-antigen ligase family protein [Lentisphaerota bacterium]
MDSRLITIFAMVAVIVLCFYSVGTGSLSVFVLMIVFFAGVFAIERSDLIAAGAIALYFSFLAPWFLPAALTISNALMGLYALITFGGILMGRVIPSGGRAANWLAYLYMAVLVFLMAMRGSGFRILGGDTWGGTYYLTQFAAVGFFLTIGANSLVPAAWRKLIFVMMMFSAVRPLADSLFFLTDGAISQQYMLVKAEVGGLQLGMLSLGNTDLTNDVFRLHSASQLGILIILAAMYGRARARLSTFVTLVLWGVGFVLCGIAGYRANMIQLVLLPVFYVLVGRQPVRLARLVGVGVACGIIYVLLLAVTPHLPGPVQRMVSILPGTEVSRAADISGRSTVEWRLRLWRQAAEGIPEHFWIGKGLVFKRAEYETLRLITNVAPDNYDYQIWSREYHNGPLALMLDLGFPGALISTLLMLALIREGVQCLKREWHDESLRCFYHVFLAYLVSAIIMFWLSFGDVRSMMGFLFIGAVLRGLWYANLRAAAEAPPVAAEPETKALPPGSGSWTGYPLPRPSWRERAPRPALEPR